MKTIDWKSRAIELCKKLDIKSCSVIQQTYTQPFQVMVDAPKGKYWKYSETNSLTFGTHVPELQNSHVWRRIYSHMKVGLVEGIAKYAN